MRAIRIKAHGGPEAMEYTEVEKPTPGPGQALVQIKAIGINYIDVYHRIGRYQTPLPFTPGQEAAGIVEAVGPGVSEVAVGDRVAYTSQMGSYAEYTVVPSWSLIKIPDGVDFPQAAAILLQGLTAHFLVNTTYPMKAGDTILLHAAAGGVGLLLTQMAKRKGARVIGTVSTEEKAQLAREAGADEVILYSQTDFEPEVKRLTEGKGVAVVYDSVGKDTFDRSLNCLRPRGFMVLFGASSGPVPPFDPATLNAKGSLYLTRPSLFHYVTNRNELLERANDVLGQIARGELKLRVEHTYALKDAPLAHRDLEARLTTGKLVLLPED